MITHILTHAAFSGRHFSHATQKIGNLNVPYCKTESPVEIKRCKTPKRETKTSGEKAILNFGIWLRHMKTGNTNYCIYILTNNNIKYYLRVPYTRQSQTDIQLTSVSKSRFSHCLLDGSISLRNLERYRSDIKLSPKVIKLECSSAHRECGKRSQREQNQ